MISIYSKKYLKNSIIIFLLTFLLIFILLSIDKIFGINKLFLFIKFNLIIIILSILHILILKKKYPTIYLVKAPFICTIFTFLLPFVLTNIFISPVGIKEIIHFNSLNKIYFLLINSLNFMWLGYWFADYLKNKSFSKNFYFQRIKYYLILKYKSLNFICLIILVLISLLGFMFMTYYNIYGFAYDASNLKYFEKYRYFLYLINHSNYVVLAALALFIFTKKSAIIVKLFFLLNLFIILIFAVFSGFKSDFFYPFIFIFFIFYITKKRISYLLFFISIFLIYFSYYPVHKIRTQMENYISIGDKKKDKFENLETTFSLFNYYSKKNELPLQENQKSKNNRIYDVVISELRSKTNSIGSRINLLLDASTLLEALSLNLNREIENPRFLESILISPIAAIIPRIIWENKPYNIEGVWATNVIFRHYCLRDKISSEECTEQTGSTAMSSFIYLYLAGGYFMVFFFYFLLGFIQNIIYNLFTPGKFLAPTFIYLFVIYKISIIDSAVYGIISFFFREFIILLILQYLIFKKNK